jgi:hypothetical protein
LSQVELIIEEMHDYPQRGDIVVKWRAAHRHQGCTGRASVSTSNFTGNSASRSLAQWRANCGPPVVVSVTWLEHFQFLSDFAVNEVTNIVEPYLLHFSVITTRPAWVLCVR